MFGRFLVFVSWIKMQMSLFCLQYVRSDDLTLPQLSGVCGELVERWDDLAVYFGNEGSGSMVELRSIPSLNVVIFNDRLARPQMAMLRWLLDEGEYKSIGCGFLLSFLSQVFFLRRCSLKWKDCEAKWLCHHHFHFFVGFFVTGGGLFRVNPQ